MNLFTQTLHIDRMSEWKQNYAMFVKRLSLLLSFTNLAKQIVSGAVGFIILARSVAGKLKGRDTTNSCSMTQKPSRKGRQSGQKTTQISKEFLGHVTGSKCGMLLFKDMGESASVAVKRRLSFYQLTILKEEVKNTGKTLMDIPTLIYSEGDFLRDTKFFATTAI
jgi:hypothetical protein